MSLEIGLTGRCESLVTEQNTAAAVGSGTLPVFATPMLEALLEGAVHSVKVKGVLRATLSA